MALSITAAEFSGMFCYAVFYGIFLVTCAGSVRVLLITGRKREERWRRPSEIHWMMAIVVLLLFIVTTLDIAMCFSRNLRAFVRSDNPLAVLTSPTDWTNLGQPVNEAVGAWAADFILIYRCWIVYSRRWPVIIPSTLLYLAVVAICLRVFAMMGAARGIPTLANANAFTTSLLAFCSTVAVQNVLTTGLLIWRIWLVERSQAGGFEFGDRPRYLHRISTVLAESGAAYTVVVLITLILTAAQSPVVYVMSDLMTPTAGISFNMILVRCSPERDRQFTTFNQNEISTLRAARQNATSESASIACNELDKPHTVELIGTKSEDRANEQPFHRFMTSVKRLPGWRGRTKLKFEFN
ncbi:hypothetical protein AN958_03608 [Leucoagaricus sp. SymC.cos]|nr:hypothetical protein AN958_03608 [Leucoagaricus sp. SymC.cos]